MTIDSLLAAEVITATGDRLMASALENPELFRALRGGGGNFGVVTRFRLNRRGRCRSE
jgi:FAD/FMN-containing dehydrogenase